VQALLVLLEVHDLDVDVAADRIPFDEVHGAHGVERALERGLVLGRGRPDRMLDGEGVALQAAEVVAARDDQRVECLRK
jgi:hypothetical protein